MFMDYISLYTALGLFLLSPLLKVSKPFTPFLIYLWVYCIFQAELPWNLTIPAGIKMSIEKDQHLIMALVAGFALMLHWKVETKKLENFLGYLCIFNLVLTIGLLVFHSSFISGIVPNKGMNGILNCMLLPFVRDLPKRLKIFALVVIFPLTLQSQSSCAYGAFIAVVSAYVFLKCKKKPTAVLFWTVAIGLASVAIGLWLVPNLFDDVRRFQIYKFYISKMSNMDLLLGNGPASFSTLGVVWQSAAKFMVSGEHREYILYMHSDPVQFLFEYGILGALPLGWLLWHILKYGSNTVLISLAALFVGGLFYYPMHFPVHLFTVFLILKVFDGNYQVQ